MAVRIGRCLIQKSEAEVNKVKIGVLAIAGVFAWLFIAKSDDFLLKSASNKSVKVMPQAVDHSEILSVNESQDTVPKVGAWVENATVNVWFSPKGGCTEAIVSVIKGAQESILVQAYSFTSVPIAEALRDAHRRKVDVRVILDKSQMSERYTSATFLHNAGVPVWIDRKHAIAHNKVIIVDGMRVITGSFNFSKAAEESNAENLLVLVNRELARRYTENWKHCLGHSKPYERAG